MSLIAKRKNENEKYRRKLVVCNVLQIDMKIESHRSKVFMPSARGSGYETSNRREENKETSDCYDEGPAGLGGASGEAGGSSAGPELLPEFAGNVLPGISAGGASPIC